VGSTLDRLVDRGWMAPDWAAAMAPVEDQIAAMGQFLLEEDRAGRGYQPAKDRIFRAFQLPLADVRVLVVGQDPYPNPLHPIGLCFAVERGVWPLPPSLLNIYRELRDDLGLIPPRHGDLSAWSDHGVMLLNRVLTVQPGVRNSHERKGWEQVTQFAVDVLAARGGPLVAILWGNPARALRPRLGSVPTVEGTHPSPLGANKGGFFGTKPFSTANTLLGGQGADPVDWRLPE
jgi:uracil-DNA glycosylase